MSIQKRASPPPAAPSVLLKAKTAYSVWFAILNDFPKIHRYTLGAKIDSYFLDLLECIFFALYASSEQKVVRLTEGTVRLDGLKFFLQHAWEHACVHTTRYTELSEQLIELGRILYGWKRGVENKLPAARTGSYKR